MQPTISTHLHDGADSGAPPVPLEVQFHGDNGLTLWIGNREQGPCANVYVEYYEGQVKVHVWDEADEEGDPVVSHVLLRPGMPLPSLTVEAMNASPTPEAPVL